MSYSRDSAWPVGNAGLLTIRRDMCLAPSERCTYAHLSAHKYLKFIEPTQSMLVCCRHMIEDVGQSVVKCPHIDCHKVAQVTIRRQLNWTKPIFRPPGQMQLHRPSLDIWLCEARYFSLETMTTMTFRQGPDVRAVAVDRDLLHTATVNHDI